MCFHSICFAFKKVVVKFSVCGQHYFHTATESITGLGNTFGTILVLSSFYFCYFGKKSARERKMDIFLY